MKGLGNMKEITLLSHIRIIKKAENSSPCSAVSIVIPKQSNRARVTDSTGTTG